MIPAVDVTLDEFLKGKEKAAAAEAEFKTLDDSLDDTEAGEALRETWQAQEDEAAANRLDDVTAMDIYNSKIEKR